MKIFLDLYPFNRSIDYYSQPCLLGINFFFLITSLVNYEEKIWRHLFGNLFNYVQNFRDQEQLISQELLISSSLRWRCFLLTQLYFTHKYMWGFLKCIFQFHSAKIGLPLWLSWLQCSRPGFDLPKLGWEDPLEKEKASSSSIPSWRIPWTV